VRGRPKHTLGFGVAAWIETYCVHGPGDISGQPVSLTDDEKRLLAWAYEVDGKGKRVVRRTLVGLPKGSRKTELAAWIALAECAGPVRFEAFDEKGRVVGRRQHDPYVVASASTYEQADLLFAAARMIVTEGPLKQYFDVFDKEIQLKGEPGVLVRVPAVAGANDGLRPTFVVADETHEWTGSKARVHLVLENGLAKRQDSWSLSITTAGNPKVESVALQQYEYGRKVLEGTIADPGFLMVWREPKVNVDELTDVKVRAKALAHANPEPWKRLDDLERRFHEVPLHEFCRYHLNMWVEPDAERWLPPGVWDGLAAGGLPEDGTKIVLGFDGSYSGDSTALVGRRWRSSRTCSSSACGSIRAVRRAGRWTSTRWMRRCWRRSRGSRCRRCLRTLRTGRSRFSGGLSCSVRTGCWRSTRSSASAWPLPSQASTRRRRRTG
jgi:phage terminase large subunit-like protein